MNEPALLQDAQLPGANAVSASWAAVAAVGVGAFALVTAEFLPVGLLPQIARDLSISDGQAGFTVMIPGLVAAFAAPMTIAFAGKLDRRYVLWVFLALLVLSNAVVALASNYPVLLLGRVLLGIAVGGFWTIGGALGPRLKPGKEAGKATALILSGISLGTVAGVPAGALLGNEFGWRVAFGASSVIALAVVVGLVVLLPSIRPEHSAGLSQVPAVLRIRKVRIGLVAVALMFFGQFASYTYIAPFLNQVTGIQPAALSAILLGYGVMGFLGNLSGGWAVGRDVRLALLSTALMLGCAVVGLLITGATAGLAITAVMIWGFAFGMMPISIQSWMFSAAPDRLESVAAVFVSLAQAAIGAGALMGGLAVDHIGVQGALSIGAIAALSTAALIGFRSSER